MAHRTPAADAVESAAVRGGARRGPDRHRCRLGVNPGGSGGPRPCPLSVRRGRAWIGVVVLVTVTVFIPRAMAAIRDNGRVSQAAGVYAWEPAPPQRRVALDDDVPLDARPGRDPRARRWGGDGASHLHDTAGHPQTAGRGGDDGGREGRSAADVHEKRLVRRTGSISSRSSARSDCGRCWRSRSSSSSVRPLSPHASDRRPTGASSGSASASCAGARVCRPPSGWRA